MISLADPWLAIATDSTLAGNFSLIGSVANLIVTQRAASEASLSALVVVHGGTPPMALSITLPMVWLGWVEVGEENDCF